MEGLRHRAREVGAFSRACALAVMWATGAGATNRDMRVRPGEGSGPSPAARTQAGRVSAERQAIRTSVACGVAGGVSGGAHGSGGRVLGNSMLEAYHVVMFYFGCLCNAPSLRDRPRSAAQPKARGIQSTPCAVLPSSSHGLANHKPRSGVNGCSEFGVNGAVGLGLTRSWGSFREG